MLRIINNFNFLRISATEAISYSTSSNTLPYNPALLPVKKSHRKPRWVPIAKSKIFRIPKRPVIPEDETREIRRLFNDYRNHEKSVKNFLVEKHNTKNQASLDPEEILKSFKQDLAVCHEINNKWNKENKILREKRLAEELERDIAFAKNRIEQEIIKEQELFEFTEELVRKEKEASVNFITKENIDDAIDKALAEAVDYNFAIDLNGEKIIGRNTKPVQEQDKISLKQ
ncbi:unnamed protein product [Ceutorhynchus assimilis]|uniref:Small ribosomal subunit protein mS26 n=1 Tax=Ceutorhynchus assimilis TaxID=467358 RepID=A0A9N9MQ33_9CUCU|nr:unnamed protein product [Ceutorhynchus assimilis]